MTLGTGLQVRFWPAFSTRRSQPTRVHALVIRSEEVGAPRSSPHVLVLQAILDLADPIRRSGSYTRQGTIVQVHCHQSPIWSLGLCGGGCSGRRAYRATADHSRGRCLAGMREEGVFRPAEGASDMAHRTTDAVSLVGSGEFVVCCGVTVILAENAMFSL